MKLIKVFANPKRETDTGQVPASVELYYLKPDGGVHQDIRIGSADVDDPAIVGVALAACDLIPANTAIKRLAVDLDDGALTYFNVGARFINRANLDVLVAPFYHVDGDVMDTDTSALIPDIQVFADAVFSAITPQEKLVVLTKGE